MKIRIAALLTLLTLFLALSPACPAGETDFSMLRINEVMASNGDSLEDEDGESPDWIELFNSGSTDVDLQGLCLSDGKKHLDKFVFPSVVIPAGGYLIVFASGIEKVTKQEIHVPFKLSADGERVVISYEGEILDIVSFDRQEKDVAYARYDERTWRFTDQPTPGAENIFDD